MPLKTDIKELDQIYTHLTPFKQKWNNQKEKIPLEKLLKLIDFKTGGFRGIMREGFNGINDVTINILATEVSKRGNNFVIGFDHRHNGDRFAYIFSKVLESHKKKFKILKYCVTPYLAMESEFFDLGIMITASHNPKEYNGVKLYKEGAQISGDIASTIKEKLLDYEFTEIYRRNKDQNDDQFIDADWISKLNSLIQPINFELYFSNLGFKIEKNMSDKIFIFSALNGISAPFIEKACEYFDIKIDTSSQFNKIEKDFNQIKYPNPELEENWQLLYKEMIIQQKIDNAFLFMCDPDGDRFGMALIENNEMTIYNANTIGKIFLWFYLKNFRHSEIVLVNTFLCDGFFEKISKRYNMKYKKTATGFKNISQGIRELLNISEPNVQTEQINKVKKIIPYSKYVLAYEDPLGYLLGITKEKDGILASLIMHNILQKYNLSDILKEINMQGVFNSYTVLLRIEEPENILMKTLKTKLYEKEHDAYFIKENGFDLYLRISGTEPMIKIYSFTNVKDEKTLKRDVDWWIKKNIKCFCSIKEQQNYRN